MKKKIKPISATVSPEIISSPAELEALLKDFGRPQHGGVIIAGGFGMPDGKGGFITGEIPLDGEGGLDMSAMGGSMFDPDSFVDEDRARSLYNKLPVEDFEMWLAATKRIRNSPEVLDYIRANNIELETDNPLGAPVVLLDVDDEFLEDAPNKLYSALFVFALGAPETMLLREDHLNIPSDKAEDICDPARLTALREAGCDIVQWAENKDSPTTQTALKLGDFYVVRDSD